MKINDVLNEQQIDELSWKDVQKGANKVAKGADKFTKNVNATGNALGGAASAIGGAAGAVGNQFIAKPVAGVYNAVKGGLQGATNVAKNVGTDIGNAAKTVGQGAANVVGGAAGAIGAVAGGATTGVGRAAANGFNTGAQAVGGNEVDRLGTVFKPQGAAATQPAAQDSEPAGAEQGQEVANASSIKQQIKQKQTEIAALQQQLQAPAEQEPAAPPQGSTATDKAGTFAKGANALSAALQKGVGMGTAGQSLADKGSNSSTTVKDEHGIDHNYKKVGAKWFDKDNKEVDSATSAMLSKQASTSTAPAAQEPISIGGQKLDPSKPADAKIIQQIQKQQQPATPAQAQAAAAPASAKIANDVQARMAKQLGKQPTAPATAAYAQKPAAGYSQATYNAPTSIPAPQPATTPAAPAPVAAKPAAAADELGRVEPTMQTASFDPAAALLRKAKIKL